MSSAGQIVGGIGGGIIGFFVGGPMGAIQGASIGASLGGYVDPPPGPDLRGPTLDDASFQSSAYGVALPRTWGSIAVTGNVIYLENNEYKAVEETEQTGGKGGAPEGTYTSTTYFATFAVALGEARPGSRPRRIWAGGKLIYSSASGDALTTVASMQSPYRWRYYDGTQSQPDARMESVLGVGNAPSYSGTSYLMLYDFELTEFGNGLSGAPIKVELSESQSFSAYAPYVVDNEEPVGEVAALNKLPMGFSFLRVHAHVGADVIASNRTSEHFWQYDYELEPSQGGGFSGINFFRAAKRSKPGNGDSGTFDYSSDPVRVAASRPVTGLRLGDGFIDGTKEHERLRVDGITYELPEDWPYEFSVYVDRSTWFYIEGNGTWYFVSQTSQELSANGSGNHYICNLDNYNSSNITSDRVYVGEGYVARPIAVTGGVDVEMYDGETLLLSHVVNIPDSPATQWIRGNIFTLDNGDLAIFGMASGSLNDKFRVLNLTKGREEFTAPDNGYAIGASFGWVYSGVGGLISVNLVQWFADTVQFLVFVEEQGVASALLNEVVSDVLDRSGVEAPDLSELNGLEVQGFRSSGPSSGRGVLSPLQVAYRFDLVESGYQLQAKLRGSESIGQAARGDLAAASYGSAAQSLVSLHRETETRLPSRYTIMYLDYNREYDTSTQYADHPSSVANERTEDVPIVMTADQAAQTADILINLSWLERVSYSFQLPQEWLSTALGRKLLPGDVLDVEVADVLWQSIRVRDISYTDDQRIEVNGPPSKLTAYSSAASGEAAAPPSQQVPYLGPVSFLVLDIPLIASAYDVPGYAVAVWASGLLRSAVVLRSLDGGQSYSNVASVTQQAAVARSINRLSPGRDYFVIDRDSVLTCRLLSGEFDSVTESQMLTGRNLCAYGAEGRWELIRFTSVDINSDGDLEFSGILGGLKGTEWAGELHEAGDHVVLLDGEGVEPIGAELESIGQTISHRAGRSGEDQQDIEPASFTYEAVNLLPLSGVHPAGQQVGNDWQISWDPRSRYESAVWVTGVEAPDDNPRLYEVVVLNGTQEVRVIQSPTADVVYTESEQVADWGSVRTSLDVAIYQVSDRVGRGYVLNASFSG